MKSVKRLYVTSCETPPKKKLKVTTEADTREVRQASPNSSILLLDTRTGSPARESLMERSEDSEEDDKETLRLCYEDRDIVVLDSEDDTDIEPDIISDTVISRGAREEMVTENIKRDEAMKIKREEIEETKREMVEKIERGEEVVTKRDESLTDKDFEDYFKSLESDKTDLNTSIKKVRVNLKDSVKEVKEVNLKKIKKDEDEVHIFNHSPAEGIDPKLRKVLSSFSARIKSEQKVSQSKPSPLTRDPSSDSNPESGFSKVQKAVPTILKSFGKSSGFGVSLKKLLPEGNEESSDALAAFLLFVLERQKVWVNKKRGTEPFTKNQVIAKKWFTNMYRELDRGTIYFRREMIRTTLKDHVVSLEIEESVVKEILFKSILYRLINKVETFKEYGGIPSPSSLSKFLLYLQERKENGVIIFTAAHQNMGFARLTKTLEYVKKNISSLTSDVIVGAQRRSSKSCFKTVLSIPNVGDFFAWQILTDLLECRVLGELTDNQWAALGPGAKNGLRKIFPLSTTRGELRYTRLVRDLCAHSGPASGFQALGLSFPAFLDKALSLKNVEHALCEYDKYFRSARGIQVKEREYSTQKSRAVLDNGIKCEVCREGVGDDGLSCVLCGGRYHGKCLPSWRGGLQQDGNWLCRKCEKYEAAWREEDAKYEEYDESDEIGRAHTSGEKKKAARIRNKKKVKSKEIECIDLSSDEESEVEDDDLYGYSSEDDDEVLFVSSVSYQSESEHSDDEDQDPFASVDEEDDEVMILS